MSATSFRKELSVFLSDSFRQKIVGHLIKSSFGGKNTQRDAYSFILGKMQKMKLSKGCIMNREGFLFNSQSGESFSLNPIAVELLSLMTEQNVEMETLMRYVVDNYDVDDEQMLLSDLSEFIFQLKKKSLLEDV